MRIITGSLLLTFVVILCSIDFNQCRRMVSTAGQVADLSEPSQCTNPRGLGIRPGVQVQNNEAPVQNNPGTVNINVPPPRLATPRFNQDGQFIGYDHGLQFLPVATLPVQSNPRTVRINIPPPRGATPRFNQDGQLIGYDHGTQFLPVAFPPGSPPS